jgi:EAL domain-containing protein (putative c-di-GMP-specific phosphodiesterase class I)
MLECTHGLDVFIVVAEGIETEQQWLALRDMGVKRGQGFLFAHAEPVERFTKEWLQQLADRVGREVAIDKQALR